MHRSRLGNLVIDCRTDDLPAAAEFWSATLGLALPGDWEGRFIRLRTPADDVRVILQQVRHAPRLHLDLETDSIPLEVRRLEQLGAVLVSRQAEWVVMQAPSGHRFCVGKPYRGGFNRNAHVWP